MPRSAQVVLDGARALERGMTIFCAGGFLAWLIAKFSDGWALISSDIRRPFSKDEDTLCYTTNSLRCTRIERNLFRYEICGYGLHSSIHGAALA